MSIPPLLRLCLHFCGTRARHLLRWSWPCACWPVLGSLALVTSCAAVSPSVDVSGACSSTPSAAYARFMSFTNTMLWRLDESNLSLISHLADQLRPRLLDPAYLVQMSLVDSNKVVVYAEAKEYPEVPSRAITRVSVFYQGLLLETLHFSAGWRSRIGEIDVVRNHGELGDLLVLHMKDADTGEPCGTEYYGFIRNPCVTGLSVRVALLYLENDKGQVLGNAYGVAYDHLSIGPRVPPRSARDCMDILRRGSDAEILECLLILSGRYGGGDGDDTCVTDSIGEFRRLWTSSDIPRVLSRSKDPWIRAMTAKCHAPGKDEPPDSKMPSDR